MLRRTSETDNRSVNEEHSDLVTLLRRVRESSESISDLDVSAIAEITGTTPEMVRVAIAADSKTQSRSPLSQIRNSIIAFDPRLRKFVTIAWMGMVVGVSISLRGTFGDRSSFGQAFILLMSLISAYSALDAENQKDSMLSGFVWGLSICLMHSAALGLLDIVWRIPQGFSLGTMIFIIFGSAAFGWTIHRPWKALTKKWGLRSDRDDRMQLLQQLVDIQDKLRAGEQMATFISLDMVGSTLLKQGSDALAVEFTFSEYHRFVESVVAKNSGRVHSTAGDGITAIFDSAQAAFRAARQIQSGLFEFNAMRNRLGKPIELRAGVHYGAVVPQGPNSFDIDFSEVIDLAAHLQKICPPCCVAISSAVLQQIGPDASLVSNEQLSTDGITAHVWRPRSSSLELKHLLANSPADLRPPSLS